MVWPIWSVADMVFGCGRYRFAVADNSHPTANQIHEFLLRDAGHKCGLCLYTSGRQNKGQKVKGQGDYSAHKSSIISR